jgi:hypothetical protein
MLQESRRHAGNFSKPPEHLQLRNPGLIGAPAAVRTGDRSDKRKGNKLMPALPGLMRAAAGMLRARLAAARRARDAGYTTEVVVVTALLVALAIAAIAIIVAKVIAKANGLNLG